MNRSINKKLTIWGINIYRVVGGKFVEGWEKADTLGMMQQLGSIDSHEDLNVKKEDEREVMFHVIGRE